MTAVPSAAIVDEVVDGLAVYRRAATPEVPGGRVVLVHGSMDRAASFLKAVRRLPELDIVGVEVLIVQGENDRFGIPPPAARRTVCVVAGDHSLRRGLDTAAPTVAEWLSRVVVRRRPRR